jgi:hypothetical protein
MGIPRKPADVKPSFKRFFLTEGGWKSVVKVFGIYIFLTDYLNLTLSQAPVEG